MPLNVFTPFTLIEAEKINENFTFVQSSLTGLTDIAVTGTVTLASSALSNGPATLKWHVCTGTTGDYTVTLPAVSGNAGKYLAFRMGQALTKLVTLKGNGSEVIDGSNTRVMFAGESAILYCDGAAWFKVAGKSIPMHTSMRYYNGSTIQVAQGAWTKIQFTYNLIDVGGMADLTSKRVNIRRPGDYYLTAYAVFQPTAANTSPNGGNTVTEIYRNGGRYKDRHDYHYPNAPGGYNIFQDVNVMAPLAMGNYIEFYVASTFTGNTTIYTDAQSAQPYLEVMEINPW